jgi:hypothetical protein
MRTYVRLWSYLVQFLLQWEMLQTQTVEEIKTHILSSIHFFSENRAVCEIMWEKCGRAGQATNGKGNAA